MALLGHGINLDGAQTGHIRDGGAGNGAEDGTGNDIHESQTAPEAAHKQTGEVKQLAGKAGLAHDLGGKNEKRNGQ